MEPRPGARAAFVIPTPWMDMAHHNGISWGRGDSGVE
jgi:hypothetical protein